MFNILKSLDLGPHSICFHSLDLTRHSEKRTTEADFVIVHEIGLFVLEVKGGGIECRDDGVWSVRNGAGQVTRLREGPFKQAHGALMALRERIEETFGAHWLARVPLGHGVIMPDCIFDVRSAEWEPWMAADRRYRDALGSWLRVLFLNWRGRVPGVPRRLDAHEIEELVRFFRPHFERLPTLDSQIEELAESVATLTESQMRGIRLVERSSRILCSGGAGTGKTFLAAELARRWSRTGDETLVVGKSPWLVAFLKQEIKSPGVTIRTLDALRRHSSQKRFTRLLVDEGQDMMNMRDLDLLDRYIEKGLEEGIWAFFLDTNNQSGVVGKFEQDALDYLQQYRPAAVVLDENCRNTETILSFIREHTDCDMGTTGAGAGPKVEVISPGGPLTQLNIVTNTIKRFVNSGIAAGSITILTAVPVRESVLYPELPESFDLELLDDISVAQRPYLNITIASIADFKGLENDVIIVTDLDRMDRVNHRRALAYIGMSRARAVLVVVTQLDMAVALKPEST